MCILILFTLIAFQNYPVIEDKLCSMDDIKGKI